MMFLLKNSQIGSDIYGLKVIARNHNKQEKSVSVNGFGEGKMTAIVATSLVNYLFESNKNGLLHSHDLINNVPDFFNEIQVKDPKFKFKL